MELPTYDLAELCDLADVTPRTVRYYVQQGLLPSPGARGPGARYDRGHLDRLQLVKRLQREHLPLSEIRARLAGLTDEAVAALLHEAPPPTRHGSALDYVRDVLAGRPPHRPAPLPPLPPPAAAPMPRLRAERAGRAAESVPPDETAAAARPAPAAAAPAFDAAPAAKAAPPPESGRLLATESSHAAPDRSTWERIALGANVELHVRRPLSRTENRLVDRLLDFARSLFADPS